MVKLVNLDDIEWIYKAQSHNRYSLKHNLQECSKCKKIKPLVSFSKDTHSINNVRSSCKTCLTKARIIENKPKKKAYVYKEGSERIYSKDYKRIQLVRQKNERENLTDGYARSLIAIKLKTEKISIIGINVPGEIILLQKLATLIRRLIKLKLNRMDKDTKKVKAIVEVVKDAFKPVQFDQFHDAKKLNTILMSTLERLTEPEPTVTVGEAMAVAKLADMMIKNTLVELKKQQVATLITHVGVSQRTISV